jgi:tetratricopeptide (TPR) repeat protein
MRTPPSILLILLVLVGSLVGPAFSAEPGNQAPIIDVQALPEFQEATKAFSAEVTFEQAALLHIYLGQYRQAVPILEALVIKQPNASGLWNALATAYNRLGQGQRAWETAQIAITLEPYVEAYYFERGLAAFQLGRDQDALADFTRYATTFTTSAKGQFYLGLTQARLGRLPDARATLTKAGSLNPRLKLMTGYYVGLIDAQSGHLRAGLAALKDTLAALPETDLPVSQQIRRQRFLMRLVDAAHEEPIGSPFSRTVVKEDIRHAAKHPPQLSQALR